ncbi:MAG: hypothetical protein MH825_04265 [Cyanobacteria bacterium]|nr:hypothetical protein [Cyanobacteriota bacterium]
MPVSAAGDRVAGASTGRNGGGVAKGTAVTGGHGPVKGVVRAKGVAVAIIP